MLSARYCRVSFGRALCIALGCNLVLANPSAQAAPSDPEELLSLCSVDSLPQDVRGSLSRYFSDWKVQGPTDLGVRARIRWGEERPMTCPGIATGHFQDRKSTSYALLLVPNNGTAGRAYKLVIYTQQSSEQYYGFKAVLQEDAGGAEVFVAAVPMTRFFDATSKWVARSRVSDAVMLVDSAATQSYLYIWSDLAYERAQVNYQ
jgi:hypothetical protein